MLIAAITPEYYIVKILNNRITDKEHIQDYPGWIMTTKKKSSKIQKMIRITKREVFEKLKLIFNFTQNI